jgi:hypothetical protein
MISSAKNKTSQKHPCKSAFNEISAAQKHSFFSFLSSISLSTGAENEWKFHMKLELKHEISNNIKVEIWFLPPKAYFSRSKSCFKLRGRIRLRDFCGLKHFEASMAFKNPVENRILTFFRCLFWSYENIFPCQPTEVHLASCKSSVILGINVERCFKTPAQIPFRVHLLHLPGGLRSVPYSTTLNLSLIN